MENRTPLYNAVKNGNENIITLLLNSNADPNIQSKSGKTPLYLARSPKHVQLLLNHYADPSIMDNQKTSAFKSLLHRSSQIAKVILDYHIETNGEEIDSNNLVLVYNLEFFREENGKREMSRHNDLITHDSDLLYHPLIEAMSRLKWNCQSNVRSLWNLIKVIFALSITSIVIGQYGNISTIDRRNCTFVQGNQNEANSEGTDFCLPVALGWGVPFGLASIAVFLLFLKEIRQMLGYGIDYFRKVRNWMDILMILCTAGFLSLNLFRFHGFGEHHEHATRIVAAIGIFFVWINIVLLLGEIPKVGVYIGMFTNVSKTLLFFMTIYSPALVAYALCFLVLMPPEVESFGHPWASFLKVMSMLVGELDYSATFITNEKIPPETSFDYYIWIFIIQIMSISFLCFGTIVIMNLLVGLTVSEMSELKSKASHVGWKRKVSELIHHEFLEMQLTVTKKERTRRLTEEIPSCLSRFHRKYTKLFHRSSSLFEDLENKATKAKYENNEGDEDVKVCVLPKHYRNSGTLIEHMRNKDIMGFLDRIFEKLPDSIVDRSHAVYFYDEGHFPPEPSHYLN